MRAVMEMSVGAACVACLVVVVYVYCHQVTPLRQEIDDRHMADIYPSKDPHGQNEIRDSFVCLSPVEGRQNAPYLPSVDNVRMRIKVSFDPTFVATGDDCLVFSYSGGVWRKRLMLLGGVTSEVALPLGVEKGRWSTTSKFWYVDETCDTWLSKRDGFDISLVVVLGGAVRVRAVGSGDLLEREASTSRWTIGSMPFCGDYLQRQNYVVGGVVFHAVPAGRFAVQAFVPSLMDIVVHDVIVNPGQFTELMIPIARGGEILGMVVDPDAVVSPNARIVAMPIGGNKAWARSSIAGTDGRFVIKGCAPGDWMLTISRGNSTSSVVAYSSGSGSTDVGKVVLP